MPAPAGAYVLRNCSIVIDDVDYANQLTKATLEPDQDTQTLKTLVPDGLVQDVDSPVWSLKIEGVSDWTPNQGLAWRFSQSIGEKLTATLVPKVGDNQPNATFTVVSMAPSMGGEQGNWNTMEMELPVDGQPVFGTTAPAAGAPA